MTLGGDARGSDGGSMSQQGDSTSHAGDGRSMGPKGDVDGAKMTLRGRARRLGDRINTDYLISSSRKKETLDPHQLKRWLLEAVDPDFSASVKDGDLLVADEAFGCGSAMEVAVTVVLAAGIKAVVAKSFSRTYYRNAINNGLLPVECDTSGIGEGDELTLHVDGSCVTVANATTGVEVQARPLPPFVLGILEAGGLVPYLRTRGGFAKEKP